MFMYLRWWHNPYYYRYSCNKIPNRCPVPSTDQALPTCFYFRISWILIENIFLVPVKDHSYQHVTSKLRTFVLEWYDPGKNELCVCTLMTDWICETELRSRPKLGKKSQKSVLSRVECRNEGSDSIGGDYFLHAKSNWNKRRTIALIAWYDTMPQTWWSASQWSEIENSNRKLLWN